MDVAEGVTPRQLLGDIGPDKVERGEEGRNEGLARADLGEVPQEVLGNVRLARGRGRRDCVLEQLVLLAERD